MSYDSTLDFKEPADNDKGVLHGNITPVTVQPGLLVRFPKFYIVSQNLLYWQRVERVIGTSVVDTNI